MFNFHIDPHVKVEGRRDNVVEAKKKILEVLETKVSALALVSFNKYAATQRNFDFLSFMYDETHFSTKFSPCMSA